MDHPTTDALRRETERFAALLDVASYHRPVAGCPGWTVGDLARHVGGIHHWARLAVLSDPGRAPGDEPQGPPDPADIEAWYVDSARQLVALLDSRDPDTPCWTMGDAPHRTRFWLRRQVQETTLHRWDAETALGREAQIDAELAWDGVDEVATMFWPRQVRLGRAQPGDTAVELRSTEFEPVVSIGAAGEPDARITGPAETILLLLWKRVPLSDPELRIDGDTAAVQRLFALPLTP